MKCSGFTLSLLFPIILLYGSFAQAGTPKATMDEPVYDFHTVNQGTIVKHTFILKNDGDATLHLLGAHPDNACTLLSPPSSIEPGTEGNISVTFQTRDASGMVTREIKLKTDDLEHEIIVLTLSGNVKPLVNVLPKPWVIFNKIVSEKVEKNVIVVTEKEGNDFEITKIESKLPFIKVRKSLLPKDQKYGPYPNKQYILVFTVDPNAPIGYHKGDIFIHTNVKGQPVKHMTVTVMLRPDVMAVPFELHYGKVSKNSLITPRLVWVSDNTKKISGFKVTGVEAEHPFIRTEITPVPSQNKTQVKVTLDTTAPQGPFMGKIKIHTNAPQEKYKTLTVTYDGTIVKQ